MKGIVRDPIMVVVFTIISCGIYGVYWLFTVRGEMKNYLEDATINPVVDTVLSFVCFPYMVYLWYKMAKDLMRMQQKAGLPEEDSTTIFLILGIFLPIVNFFLAQQAFNAIWTKNAE